MYRWRRVAPDEEENEIDLRHVAQMKQVYQECNYAEKCRQDINAEVLRGGIGVFRNGKLVRNIKQPLAEFLAYMKSKSDEILTNGNLYGYVVYSVNEDSQTVCVEDPLAVRVIMRKKQGEDVQYFIKSRIGLDPDPTVLHDPRFRIWIFSPPDFYTGLTTGGLSRTEHLHIFQRLELYADITAGLINATPMAYLENPDKNSALRRWTKDSVVVGRANAVPGEHESLDDLLDAQSDEKESTYKANMALAKHAMGSTAEARYPGIYSKLNMEHMPDAAATLLVTVPPGTVVRQREIIPRHTNLPDVLKHFNREIAVAMGVPPDSGEHRPGKQFETEEMDETKLRTTCVKLQETLNAVLGDISNILQYGQRVALKEELERQGMPIEDIIREMGPPLVLRVLPNITDRELDQLYMNEVLEDDKYKWELTHRNRVLQDSVRKKDGRKIMREDGGPGRKGGDTLTKRKTQKQGAGHAGKRKAAQPGKK